MHHFVALLEAKGVLTRCYTQNIDSLESAAGVTAAKLVAAHGNMDSASCVETGAPVPIEAVRDDSATAAAMSVSSQRLLCVLDEPIPSRCQATLDHPHPSADRERDERRRCLFRFAFAHFDRSVDRRRREGEARRRLTSRVRARTRSLLPFFCSLPPSPSVSFSLSHRAARCCRSLSWAQVRRALCDEEDGGGGGWRRLRDAHGGLVKPDIVFFGEVGPRAMAR